MYFEIDNGLAVFIIIRMSFSPDFRFWAKCFQFQANIFDNYLSNISWE